MSSRTAAPAMIPIICHLKNGGFMNFLESRPAGLLLTYFIEIWLHSSSSFLSEFYIRFTRKKNGKSEETRNLEYSLKRQF